jgi:hypothetical protein
MKKIFFSVLLIGLCLCSNAEIASTTDSKHDFQSVRIWFYGWNIFTRTPLTVDDVKNARRLYFEVREKDRIHQVLSWLDLDAMDCGSEKYFADPRLVVELVGSDGEIVTYYADETQLLSSNALCHRKINARFRKRFDLWSSCFE